MNNNIQHVMVSAENALYYKNINKIITSNKCTITYSKLSQYYDHEEDEWVENTIYETIEFDDNLKKAFSKAIDIIVEEYKKEIEKLVK